MNLNELRDDSYARARRKGFYDPVPTIESRYLLIHSEVSEALEEYRDDRMVTTLTEKGKPIGFPTELADIVIRIADLFGHLALDLELWGRALASASAFGYEGRTVEQDLFDLHRMITPRAGVSPGSSYAGVVHLGEVVDAVFLISKRMGIDLEMEIRRKSDYNETRPAKHGRVRL